MSTPEELKKKIKILIKDNYNTKWKMIDQPEYVRWEIIKLLCETLKDLGYKESVKLFFKVDKAYEDERS